MTNLNHQQQLESAYKQRKKQHKLPASSKRLIKRYAAKENQQFSWQNAWRQSYALATALAIVGFAWLFLQHSTSDVYQIEKSLTVNNVQLEIHSIQTEDPLLFATSSKQNEMLDASQRWQEANQLSGNHHVRIGKLTNKDNEWSITACDNSLIKLSESFITSFKQQQLLPDNIKAGDFIRLTSNSQGYILAMSKAKELAMCEHS